MSVTTFDPTSISITDAARAHLQRQMEASERRHLRLGVKESGCNGYMYTLDYIDDPNADDHAFDLGHGVVLYVRESELDLVRGTEVDYVTEGLNSSLRFKNPQATTYCGCGESFAVAGA